MHRSGRSDDGGSCGGGGDGGSGGDGGGSGGEEEDCACRQLDATSVGAAARARVRTAGVGAREFASDAAPRRRRQPQ